MARQFGKVGRASFLSAVAIVVGTAAGLAADHPVPIITADLYVNRTKATMQLKFFAEDLELIQEMQANAQGLFERSAIDKAFAAHREYLRDGIQLRDVDGSLVAGKIVDFNDSDIPPEGIQSGKLMNFALGMVLEYSFERPPEVLTLWQDISDPNFVYMTEMNVLVKQAGMEGSQSAMIKNAAPETFRFDWTTAQPGEAASDKDWQKWFDEQREKELGIASYSSTYSFFYITRYEVRNEILVPLACLSEISFTNADPAFLEIAEQDAIRPEIENYFVNGNPVQIDGVAVKPLVDRIDFYGADVRDFVRQAERRRVSIANGRVGIMLRYPTKRAPSEVRLTWNRFSAALKDVEAIIFPFDQVERTRFARYLSGEGQNEYVWRNPGTPPLPQLTEIERKGTPTSQPALFFLAGAGCGLLLGLGSLRRRNWPLALASGIALAACATFAWQAQRGSWPRLIWPREQVTAEMARSIFQQLHQNIFRAFDYQEDEDIYDALAASVDGNLLRELNLQIQERLKMADQGGARSRIDQVELLDGRIDPESTAKMPAGFSYRSKWNLVGSVEHWGHVHQRSIVYEGVFRVEPRERAWKITAMDITHEEPPQVKTSLRRL